MNPDASDEHRRPAHTNAVRKRTHPLESATHIAALEAHHERSQIDNPSSLGFTHPVRISLPLGRCHQPRVKFPKVAARFRAQCSDRGAFSMRMYVKRILQISNMYAACNGRID